MNAMTRLTITLAAVAVFACADSVPSTSPTSAVPAPLFAAHMRATVDVIAGTLTFEPIASPSASFDAGRDASAAIYGNQGVTVRIYNSPVVVSPSATPGKKRYSANVGVRNLLAHPIGDEQAGLPAHTLGIFVFVSAGPTVTATSLPCSLACTVTVVNQHGIFPFSAPEQRYWYWPERLSAAGGGSDTTALRKAWTFQADLQVTEFQFDVLVSAAWPPPNDSRWKVTYDADSLPDIGTEPGWLPAVSGSGSTTPNTPARGNITITALTGGRRTYFRTDSLNTTTNAYVQARFRINEPPTLSGPEVSFGIDDEVKFIAAGASSSQAGFLTGFPLSFQTGQVAVTTTSFHVYEIRKYAADSVVLYIDGVRRISKLYSAFPARLLFSAHGFYFGPFGVGAGASVAGNSSSWDYVIFETGASQP